MEKKERTLQRIMDAAGAQVGTFWFYHRFEDGMIRPLAVCGGEKLDYIYLLPGEGVAGRVIDTGEAILVPDCRKDARWTKKVDVETGFITRSMLCFPLKFRGNTFGCIQLINKKDNGSFTEEDLKIAVEMAEPLPQMMFDQGYFGDCNMDEDPEKALVRQSDVQRAIFRQISIYTDPSIVREILRQDGKHKKSTKMENIAVLFVDIRGFTGLAQVLDAAQLISVLSDFLSLGSHSIHRHCGTIDKFMGDCVMAYWPLEEHPEGEYLACLAALDIQKEAVKFAARIKRQTGLCIGLGVGLHAGPALMCHVGDEEYMAYTVIGHTVNTACRMEEYAPSGCIYMSESMAERVGDRIKTEPLTEDVTWKNKDDTLVVVNLVGEA